MRRIFVMGLALFGMLLPQRADAQLTGVINRLFDYGDCGVALCLSTDASPGHGNHFIPALQANASNVFDFIGGSIASSVASFPIASATSGVTFEFDAAGLPVERRVSAGPVFAERAQTLGRGRLHVGANVSGLSFRSVRGVDLSDLEFTFTHTPGGDEVVGDIEFENDLIVVQANLELDLYAANFFASYGVTDNIDVSVSVPFLRASLWGETFAQVQVFGNPAHPAHNFGTTDPRLDATSEASGSASGIGDVAARVKMNVFRDPLRGAAVLAEVRLPTGSEEDFLGAGEAQIRLMGIASARYGNFTPHLNAGFWMWPGSEQGNSVLATVGFDQLVTPSVTFSGDIISRIQVGDGLSVPAPVEVVGRGFVNPTNIPATKDHQVDAAVGLKFAPLPFLNLAANVLVPLNQGGMRPSAAWTLGLEYHR